MQKDTGGEMGCYVCIGESSRKRGSGSPTIVTQKVIKKGNYKVLTIILSFFLKFPNTLPYFDVVFLILNLEDKLTSGCNLLATFPILITNRLFHLRFL